MLRARRFRWFLWLALLRAGTGLRAQVGPPSRAPLEALQAQLEALQAQLHDVRRQLFDLRAQLP